MAKNKKKQTNTIVVKTSKRRRSRRSGSQWASVVADPFNHKAVHIPDQMTRPSGLVTSQLHFRYNPRSYDNSTTSTTHSGGILLRPTPYRTALLLGNNGGYLTSNLYPLNINTSSGLEWRSAPNQAAMVGNYGQGSTPAYTGALVRCVAMGIRLTFESPELYRGGSIIGVQLSNNESATTFGTADSGGTNYHYDPLSVYTGQVQNPASTSTLADPEGWAAYGNRIVRTRVADGVFEMHWIPPGVPEYHMIDYNMDGTRYASLKYTTAAGATSTTTLYSNDLDDPGLSRGTGAILVAIEGDYSSVASVAGNPYAVDIIAHWEVIPADYLSTTLSITPSNFKAIELEKALNAFGKMLSGAVMSYGSTSLSGVSSNVEGPFGTNMSTQTRFSSGKIPEALMAMFTTLAVNAISNSIRPRMGNGNAGRMVEF